jgi:hypothetical protein
MGDQLTLDGVALTDEELAAPRVFDEEGKRRCPSCYSRLRRGWFCRRCNGVGVTAPDLLNEGDEK